MLFTHLLMVAPATTFDAISVERDYLGGAISPGVRIAAEALSLQTAKLPSVDLQRPPAAIGRNTTQAMQSGLLFGFVALVEGMVARFRTELGPEMKVIATGDLARIDHRFGNEGDFGRPERFSESCAIDPVQVE